MAAPLEEQYVSQTIGLRVAEAQREQKGLEFVVKAVLQEVCKASLGDILCLQDLPAQGIYDVTFYDEPVCAKALQRLKTAADGEVLHGIEFTPGGVSREVPITVQMCDAFCSYDAIVAFLQIYCDQVGKGVKLYNSYDVWNCRRRFVVTLESDDAGIGGTRHPPAVFTIGSCPGFLYYPGQPKYCSTCSAFGHFRSECAQEDDDRNEDSEVDMERYYPTLTEVEENWRYYAEELVHRDDEDFIRGNE